MHRRVIAFAWGRIGRGALLLALLGLVSGCAQTLAQAYLDPSDPCYAARKPIADAGDALDRQQRAMADQYAAMRMQGHERPVVVQNGNRMQINFGNAVANAVEQAGYSQQAYMALKANEHGQNAAATLAAINGDAQNDYYQLQRVGATIRQLRECRREQAVLVRTSYLTKTVSVADASQRLDGVRAASFKDDELVNKVFQQYGQRATLYANSETSLGGPAAAAPYVAPSSRGTRPSPRRAAPPPQTHSVASLERQQSDLVERDQGDRNAVRDAIDAARVGLQQRTELLGASLAAPA